MTIPSSCDVVIIGGGPAGSMSAATLAQKGYDVVVLERSSHPRPQVGESLIPDFWKYTDRVGVTEKIEAEQFITKAGAIVSWGGQLRAHTFADFGYDRPAMHVERDRFDQILFEHAGSQGARTFENINVTHFEGGTDDSGADYSRVAYKHTTDGTEGEITAKYTIDASGQTAVISRQLGIREIVDEFRSIGLWGYFEDSRFLTIDGHSHEAAAIADLRPVTFVSSLDDADDGGWAWHIALREKASVGLVLPLRWIKDARREGENWEQYFLRRTAEVPILGEMLAPSQFIEGSFASMRDYSSVSTQLAGPGWFLTGDAGGFIDPIFSVGIALTLYSAAAVAWAVDRVITQPQAIERTRAIFAGQIYGRVEVARSLALPQYRSSGKVSDLAKEAVKFSPSAVQELMYVVSSFTTRSDNWLELVGGTAPELQEGQWRELDRTDIKV